MSHTDKTDPPWVQLERMLRINKVLIIHYCHSHDCKPMVWRPSGRRQHECCWRHDRVAYCDVWGRSGEEYKIFKRRPRKSTRKELGNEGKIRAQLRKLRQDWKYSSTREDIDSSFGAPRRHCQVRDLWSFD